MEHKNGIAHKYGNNINTDIISPPQYMELSIQDASAYAMQAVDLNFAKKVKKGDIFVAENNLGSGSSRETSPLTLKYLGISCVIAKSFARIFYRNCINVGIPALQCKDTDKIKEGDQLEIDITGGKIKDITTGETYHCDGLPKHILAIIEAGGMYEYLKKNRRE